MEPLRQFPAFFIFFFVSLLLTTVTASSSTMEVSFVRTWCAKTTFPSLCFRSLSPHAISIRTSPRELVGKAIGVALSSARTTSTQLSNMTKTTKAMRTRQAEAMEDCVENVRCTADELQRSVTQFDHLGGKSLGFEINNVQTWVSAALTSANTCMYGFSSKSMDGSLKSHVEVKISHLAKLTSNALSLVNQLV